MFSNSAKELAMLTARVLADYCPDTVAEAAYLFSETRDNEVSVMGMGAQLVRDGRARRLVLCDGGTDAGYPGAEDWRGRLTSGFDVPVKSIETVQIPGRSAPNTRSEAETIVKKARDEGWEMVLIVAPAFHQIRAFATAVSAASRLCPSLKLYSVPGLPLRWGEKVVHSQGVVTGTRAAIFDGELDRLDLYHEKGDILSAKAILEYLDQRN